MRHEKEKFLVLRSQVNESLFLTAQDCHKNKECLDNLT